VDIAVVNLDEEAVDLDTFVALVALEALDFFRLVAVDLVPLVVVDMDPFETAKCVIEY